MIRTYVALPRGHGKTTRLLDAVADAVAIGQKPIILCANEMQAKHMRTRINDLGCQKHVFVSCIPHELRGHKPPLFIDNWDMFTPETLRIVADTWLEDIEMATYTIPGYLPDEW